jgi:hypothetical protein
MKTKYDTFKERNELLLKFEKLPIVTQTLILARTLGAYSVTSDSPIFWNHLEKFVEETTGRQPTLFQQLADTAEITYGNKIDKFIDTTQKKLDNMSAR